MVQERLNAPWPAEIKAGSSALASGCAAGCVMTSAVQARSAAALVGTVMMGAGASAASSCIGSSAATPAHAQTSSVSAETCPEIRETGQRCIGDRKLGKDGRIWEEYRLW